MKVNQVAPSREILSHCFVCINQFINFKVAALLGLLLALPRCRAAELPRWRVCKRLSKCFAFCHAAKNANANSSAVRREMHKMLFEKREFPGRKRTETDGFRLGMQRLEDWRSDTNFICHFVTLTQWKCNMLMSNFMNERDNICHLWMT